MRKCVKSTIIAAGSLLSLMVFSSHAFAALSCNPQGYASIIGTEVVAVQCIPDGMNDSTAIYYRYRDYECIGGVVTKTAEGNTVLNAPNGIQYPSNGMGSYFRHFRNKEGSYFFEVSTWYRGTIDGKSMSLSAYPGGGVYPDVFTKIIDMTSLPAVPDCKGKEPDQCTLERQASSTVNMATGRLSHSQELFRLDNNRTLSLGVELYYRSSSPFAPSNIGNGWSHNYEAALVPGSGSAMVFWNQGIRKDYEKYSAVYVSPKGDTSTLVKNGDNTWTITELDGLKRNFDTAGKLTSIVDRYANTLTFAYSSGKLASVTDATGRTVSFGYNATTAKLETITEPETSGVHTLAYPSGKLDTVTPPGNKVQWAYTYGTNGLLATKKDPENNLSSYTYYTDNRLKDATDPLNKPRAYAYPSPVGNPGKIPDAYPLQILPVKQFNFIEKDGNGWTYTYDTLTMSIRTASDPYGKITSYYYNPDGTLRAKTVPFDGAVKLTTFYTYDSNGNLLTQTDPIDISSYVPAIDPQTATIASLASRIPPIRSASGYTYDAANYYQIKTVTDYRGVTPLTTTYDRFSEPDGQGGTWLVTRTTTPGEVSGTTLVSYQRQNANGTLASATDANGKITSSSYYPVDATTIANGTAGMLQTVTMPDNSKLVYTTYDKNGNATEFKLIDANNNEIPVKTTQGYDPQNKLASILKESTIQPNRFPANLTRYGYDNNGNRSSVTDAEGRTTTYKYTYQGQIAEMIDARLKSTKFDYSGTGCNSCSSGVDKLTAVRDVNQVANNQPGTLYAYDKSGRLEYETDPLDKKIRYTYYDNGLLREKIDVSTAAENVLITYTYHTRGQLTDKAYPDGSGEHFTYYPDGKLWTATNQNISYSYVYYSNGRLQSITDNSGRQISYDAYDGLGQRKLVTILKGSTDQHTIAYDYDSANRPWNITSSAGQFSYAYDALGRRQFLHYPNQTTASYGYDDLNRLTSLTHQVINGPTLASFTYPVYDGVDNRKTAGLDGNQWNYIYDDLYHFLEKVSPAQPEKFTYDDVGNRKSGPGYFDGDGYTSAYRYNAANQMLSGRKLQYGYDNAGNQTTRTQRNAADKTWTQTWDYGNRLVKVEKIKGGEQRTVSFSYDPLGRRIGKQITTIVDGIETTQTYTYIYDDQNIAVEIYSDASGTIKTFYTHGAGIDEHLALERNGSFAYFHADGLGSITSITDANWNVVQTYEYDSFGMVKPSTSFCNSYTYTGREWDKETGLYYYRARYYDPMEGRFISKDPIGFDGEDVNLYAYVGNQPINYVDPYGLARFDPGGIVIQPIPIGGGGGGFSGPGAAGAAAGAAAGSAIGVASFRVSSAMVIFQFEGCLRQVNLPPPAPS